MAARWSRENVVVEFRDAQVLNRRSRAGDNELELIYDALQCYENADDWRALVAHNLSAIQ